jgi:hypothetical protein
MPIFASPDITGLCLAVSLCVFAGLLCAVLLICYSYNTRQDAIKAEWLQARIDSLSEGQRAAIRGLATSGRFAEAVQEVGAILEIPPEEAETVARELQK